MLKDGVIVKGIQPETVLGYIIVQGIFFRYKLTCTITSALDGKHGANSLHPKGYALDFRSKHLRPLTKKDIETVCKKALGKDYFFFLEAEGTDNEHFHMEYDPK